MGRILPILFNGDMVRATLEDRKTVTRRAVKYARQDIYDAACLAGKWSESYGQDIPEHLEEWYIKNVCRPPFGEGDILYVRETWRIGAWDIHNRMIAFDYKDGTFGELVHIRDRSLFERLIDQSREEARKSKCKYSGVDFVWRKGESPCRWRPSIHMPKEIARIWLKVTDVRVERLHKMEIGDYKAEGVLPVRPKGLKGSGCDCAWKHDGCEDRPCSNRDAYNNMCYQHVFIDLWDSTIKSAEHDLYGWSANPWVWVIGFERCGKPEVED